MPGIVKTLHIFVLIAALAWAAVPTTVYAKNDLTFDEPIAPVPDFTSKPEPAQSETTAVAVAVAENAVQAYLPALPSGLKGVLLFVGYTGKQGVQKHPEYTDADIAKLLDGQHGANTKEFIITTSNDRYNVYATASGTKSIVSEADIANMQKSLTGETNDNVFALMKEQYNIMLTGNRLSGAPYRGEDLGRELDEGEYSGVNVPSSRVGPTSPVLTLDSFVSDSVVLAKRLIATDPSVTVWFAFPPITFEALAECYITPYQRTVVDGVKQLLSPAQWKNNVAGFYFGTESLSGWYTYFDPQIGGHFGNPVVKCMSAVSNYVRGLGKKMLWIPYYGHHYDGTSTLDDERIGAVVNGTHIFDYVVVQPSYYFNEAQRANMAHLAGSLAVGALKNSGGSLVLGGKASATAFGVEMELDARIASQASYGARYAEYVGVFGPYKRTSPVVFYAGDRDSLMHPDVLREIHKFFT